jgi:hypothetical protein
MSSKATRGEKVIIGVCVGILMFFAFTIAVRFVTRQILTNHFKMDNFFTETVWFDRPSYASLNGEESQDVEIDWESLYPFDGSESNIDNTEQRLVKTSDNWLIEMAGGVTDIVASVEDKIETYATDLVVFYTKILECANAYEAFIGWNFAPYDEYNGVVKLADGYLSVYKSEGNPMQQYEALYELNEFCKNKDIDFAYIQAPYKISEYDDTDVSGIVDFSNQNADELIKLLKDGGIDYYDIRETIHEDNISNHELFFKTDHHWLTTTGLWAAQKILSFCNDTYGWNADLSLLNADQSDYVTYEDWFLGSQGKKITLSRCEPDDIMLFYPEYKTKFYYCIPSNGIDVTGDFSVTYDMSAIDECDYYNNNPYSVCNYGDQPLIKIENKLYAENHRILIIHDSFGDPVISCLALAEKNIDSLDVRHFTGSVKAYIDESNSDLVIVMYTASSVGQEIDYSTHTDKFDFR